MHLDPDQHQLVQRMYLRWKKSLWCEMESD